MDFKPGILGSRFRNKWKQREEDGGKSYSMYATQYAQNAARQAFWVAEN